MLKLAMGTVLLVTATQVVAVSLGATQGEVIIGRPLDLLVQSNITASDAASGLCLETQVAYGDTRIAPSAVTTVIQELGAGGRRAIRIRVAQPVNEPIVSVTVQAGCTAAFRRSYTLLADVEPALVAAAAAAVVDPLPVPRVSRPVTQVPSAPASPGGAIVDALDPETPIVLAEPAPRPAAVTRMRSKTAPLPTVVSEVLDAQASRQAAGAVVAEAPPSPPGPRLQLEPVDLAAPSVPVAANAEDATAGPVVLGQDLPVDMQAALAQQQVLQQEVETLRAEQERMRLAIETLNAQLLAAQQPPPMAEDPLAPVRQFGLPALALLLMGGAWYVLRRRRRSVASALDPKVNAPWWASALPDVPPRAGAEPAIKSPPGAEESSFAQADAWHPESVEGLEVAEGRESMFREVPVAALQADRLQDLWQRVEFFCSLGQHTQARDLLKNFVTQHARASEGPYLWWLCLDQRWGSESDRVSAARFYEAHFQRIPPALAVVESALCLADDASIMGAIADRWPAAGARQLIEAALASQPGDVQSPLSVRSLNVFDDLVTLLGLLDALDTLGAAPVVAPSGGGALGEPEAEFPAWQSVADLSPKSVKPREAMLDFDLDMFELEPKEARTPAEPNSSTRPLDKP
jgi:hypothetical protein